MVAREHNESHYFRASRRLDWSVMPQCSRHQLWTCFVPQLSNAVWTISAVVLPTTAPRASNRLVKPVFVGERSRDFCLPKADSNGSVVPSSRSAPRTAWHCSDTNAINSPARRTPLSVVAKGVNCRRRSQDRTGLQHSLQERHHSADGELHSARPPVGNSQCPPAVVSLFLGLVFWLRSRST